MNRCTKCDRVMWTSHHRCVQEWEVLFLFESHRIRATTAVEAIAALARQGHGIRDNFTVLARAVGDKEMIIYEVRRKNDFHVKRVD